MLVRKEVNRIVVQVYIDSYGHFIIFNLAILEVDLVLVNSYGPTKMILNYFIVTWQECMY